jgi:hypothetical protein
VNLLIIYIVGLLLTFFAASFAIACWGGLYDPTEPETFLLLVGYALVWPISVPWTAAGFLLLGIAMLASELAGGEK